MWKYIIWDWNGTLLDDISASLQSVNDMLERRGMEPISVERYKECIEVPIRGFYEKVFNIENEIYENLLKEYNEGYIRNLVSCSLTDGVEEALTEFRNAGCIQLIVSSSNKKQLTENAKKYGVYQFFDTVIGSDDYFAGSKIEKAIDYLNGHEKGPVLVIGDLAHDADMAKQIGAECVLLKSGHENPDKLKQSDFIVLDSIRDLFGTYVCGKDIES